MKTNAIQSIAHSALCLSWTLSVAHAQAPTARVGDVTHLQGQGRNVLVGYGLVTGLDKTGDGGKFMPTMRAVAEMMARFGAPVESVKDIDQSKNTAVVMLEATIPDHGAREGELLDVSVTALAAKSLSGGRLITTPMIYHDRTVDGLFAFASGRIVVDPTTPTAGVIRQGARIERDVFMNVIATGGQLHATGITTPWINVDETYLTLVIDEAHASWSMSTAIAQALDKELGLAADVNRVALALDAKNVVVLLPKHQRGDPASWIREVERTPILMEAGEARVTINRRVGTIVVTGETRISPVIISQQGMTVTVANNSATAGGKAAPQTQDFVALDAESQRPASVTDLLDALNKLKVQFKDRVSILEEIHRAGKLHAKLIYEG
jgi:flagellar P-ring protein precursor FlgI